MGRQVFRAIDVPLEANSFELHRAGLAVLDVAKDR